MVYSRSMDIIEAETGEILHTAHSKYGGQTTIINAGRWCERHGFTCVGFETYNNRTSMMVEYKVTFQQWLNNLYECDIDINDLDEDAVVDLYAQYTKEVRS